MHDGDVGAVEGDGEADACRRPRATSSRTRPWRRNDRVPRSSRSATRLVDVVEVERGVAEALEHDEPDAEEDGDERQPRGRIRPPRPPRPVRRVGAAGPAGAASGRARRRRRCRGRARRRGPRGPRGSSRVAPAPALGRHPLCDVAGPPQDPHRVPADGDERRRLPGEDVPGVVHQARTSASAAASARRSAMARSRPDASAWSSSHRPRKRWTSSQRYSTPKATRARKAEQHEALELHVEGRDAGPLVEAAPPVDREVDDGQVDEPEDGRRRRARVSRVWMSAGSRRTAR